MSEFKFNCPHCAQHLKCDEQMSGRQIQCPSCNHLIRIPAVPGRTANYRPQSGKTWDTFVPSGQKATSGGQPQDKARHRSPKKPNR